MGSHDDSKASEFLIKDEVLNVSFLIKEIWKRKLLIVILVIAGTFAGFSSTKFLTEKYEAYSSLSPSSSGSNSNSLSNGLGGLASLAGISFSQSSVDQTTLAIEVLQSRIFFLELIKDETFFRNVIAAESFDLQKKEIIYKPNVLTEIDEIDLENKARFYPLVQKAYVEFQDMLRVEQDLNTGLVKITIKHVSPYFAKNTVEQLITELNNQMKQREIEQAESSIEYLMTQLERTEITSLRESFFNLIEGQTEKIMLAQSNPEFVFRVVDPAFVSEVAVEPNRVKIVILSFLLALILSVAFCTIQIFREQNKNQNLETNKGDF